MPAGIGYLGQGSTWLSNLFSKATSSALGAGRQNLARTTGLMSRGFGSFAAMEPIGQRAVVGGVAGGMYGAFADNTSILGGAMIGAGIGAGSVGVDSLGRTGYGAYKSAMMAPGLGRGKATADAFVAMGQQSRGFIGNTSRRALNGFRALGIGPRIDKYLWPQVP